MFLACNSTEGENKVRVSKEDSENVDNSGNLDEHGLAKFPEIYQKKLDNGILERIELKENLVHFSRHYSYPSTKKFPNREDDRDNELVSVHLLDERVYELIRDEDRGEFSFGQLVKESCAKNYSSGFENLLREKNTTFKSSYLEELGFTKLEGEEFLLEANLEACMREDSNVVFYDKVIRNTTGLPWFDYKYEKVEDFTYRLDLKYPESFKDLRMENRQLKRHKNQTIQNRYFENENASSVEWTKIPNGVPVKFEFIDDPTGEDSYSNRQRLSLPTYVLMPKFSWDPSLVQYEVLSEYKYSRKNFLKLHTPFGKDADFKIGGMIIMYSPRSGGVFSTGKSSFISSEDLFELEAGDSPSEIRLNFIYQSYKGFEPELEFSESIIPPRTNTYRYDLDIQCFYNEVNPKESLMRIKFPKSTYRQFQVKVHGFGGAENEIIEFDKIKNNDFVLDLKADLGPLESNLNGDSHYIKNFNIELETRDEARDYWSDMGWVGSCREQRAYKPKG